MGLFNFESFKFLCFFLDYSLRYLLPMMKNSASEDVTNPPTVVKVSNNEDLNGLDVLFAILDNESERLGIANYTLECTTLEQIFLEMERQAVVDPGVQKLMAKVGMKEQNFGMYFKLFLHSGPENLTKSRPKNS